MRVLDKIKNMPMDEFYHLCNRLVREMGFFVRNGVYRENTVVIDAHMELPGGNIRYVIIFLKKERLSGLDLEELVDFDTLQIRWMIVVTGTVEKSAYDKIPSNMDINILNGDEFEKLVMEFGIIKEENEPGRFLPSAGKLDEEISWAEEFLKNRNHQKALEHIDRALSIKSTPRAIKVKARILGEMGRYDEALSLLKHVLEENVRDDDAWFILGGILESMGRLEEAEEAYAQCTRFNSRNLGCWLNRGNLLFTMENHDESLLCYENALKIRQDLPDAWNNRGVVLKHLGKYDEAMRSYNAAIKYNPQFANAYLNKAILFYEMRRYEEAENAVFQYLKLEESEEGYILLANIYLKRQMLGKAEEAAKKVLELNPGSIEAKKILRKIYGGKTKDIEADVMHGIKDILSMLPEEELEPVRNILAEAQALAEKGEFEKVKEKLQEAREHMQNYVDERMMKNAIIEDIVEIAQESGEVVPEDVDAMDLDELRLLRSNLIRKIRRKGSEDKTREKLLDSLERIRGDLEKNDMLGEDMENAIDEAKNLIQEGKFSDALENLLKISARVEKEKISEMKRFLITDTRELLEDANMDVPYNLEAMELEDIRELRKKALESLTGREGGGLKDMLTALSTGSMKDAIIGDIRELAEYSDEEIPENLESMDMEELKELRRRIIENMKKGGEREAEVKFPRGIGQALLELGKYDELLTENIEEDEYLANARGVYYFDSGDYKKAIEQFKRALAINPEFREAEFNLGCALYRNGSMEEGLMHLRRVGMEDFVKKKNLNP